MRIGAAHAPCSAEAIHTGPADRDVHGATPGDERIDEARERCRRQPGLRFVCADARSFVARPAVDAVISWHTSFGFSAEDRDQRLMLTAFYRSLRPGGRLLLDYPNFYHTLAHFEPVFRQHWPSPGGEVEVWRHSEILPAEGLLQQRWCFRFPNGEQAERSAPLRIYLPDRLAALLAEAGFALETVYGSATGEPFALASPRWIGVARRCGYD